MWPYLRTRRWLIVVWRHFSNFHIYHVENKLIFQWDDDDIQLWRIYINIYHFYVACRGEPTNVDMCQFLSGLFFIRPIIILLLISNVIWTFSIIYIKKMRLKQSGIFSYCTELSMLKPLLTHLRSIFRIKEILCYA